MMTTLPSSRIPQASLVDLWRRMLYGKTTSWLKTKFEKEIRFLLIMKGMLLYSKLYKLTVNAFPPLQIIFNT